MDESCYLFFQENGDLVLRDKSGAYLWAAGTGGNDSTLILSDSDSYMTIKSKLTYQTKWSTGKASPGLELASKAMSLPLRQSSTAKSFIDMLGVGIHIDQHIDTYASTKSQLNYLGIKNVRAGLPRFPSATSVTTSQVYSQVSSLARDGFNINLVSSDSNFDWLIPTYERFVNENSNTSKITFEGPNEINNWPINCSGKSFTKDSFYYEKQNWGQTLSGSYPAGEVANCYMTSFYKRVKASPILKNFPVYNLTSGEFVYRANHYSMLNLAGKADFNNIHVYPRIDESGVYQPRQWMLGDISRVGISPLAAKTVITEMGYESVTNVNDTSKNRVSDEGQAILTLNAIFDAFDLGIHKVFLYTMTNDSQNFGLFKRAPSLLDDYGPTLAKPVAKAIRNMTLILKDSGTSSPSNTSLNYWIGGMDTNTYSLLLQKSNGRFYIILWNENPPVISGQGPVSNESIKRNLTLNFNSAKKVNVYKPVINSTPVESTNSTYVSTYSLELWTHPIIVEVIP